MTQVTPWVSGTDGLEPRPLPQHDRSSDLYPWDCSPRWGLLSFVLGTSASLFQWGSCSAAPEGCSEAERRAGS